MKRRHDDQDDPDRHGGEQTTITIQPETGSTPHRVESQVDPIEPKVHDVDTTLSLTSAEVSLDVGPMVESLRVATQRCLGMMMMTSPKTGR